MKSLPEPLRAIAVWTAAVIFAVCELGYGWAWMDAAHILPSVELGFEHSPTLVITSVAPNSPAQRAGLRTGDRVVAVDSTPVSNERTMYRAYGQHSGGSTIAISVVRPGENHIRVLTGVLRHREFTPDPKNPAQNVAGTIRNFYVVPLVMVGLCVLFSRVRDKRSWLLSFMFAGLMTAPGIPGGFGVLPPELRGFVRIYQPLVLGLLGASFYCFFAIFPVRSRLDVQMPWLKWAGIACGLAVGLPGIFDGQLQLPRFLAAHVPVLWQPEVPVLEILLFICLGLVSLAMNYFGSPDEQARRRIRVLFWGTVVGIGPAAARGAFMSLRHVNTPWWIHTISVLMLFVFPLSFAYAVVKHRVLEIPVLLRRSARYLLVQRGSLVLLGSVCIAVTVLLASAYDRYWHWQTSLPQGAGIVFGAMVGTSVLLAGTRIHKRVAARIDRAFFRSSYDAQKILTDLVELTREARDRKQLAELLKQQIASALQPEFVTVYLSKTDGKLELACGTPVDELAMTSKGRAALEEVSRIEQRPGSPVSNGRSCLPHAECVAPMPMRRGELGGLVVLGPRRSEEPYSREDTQLLTSVVNQAGTVLENLRLADEIAERIESERRVQREIEIAQLVQARLLPQHRPELKTLECAAQCVQARSVGGDYYDFVPLGPGRVALVLADVSGKGVHAALLVANLQAHLRGQLANSPEDPVPALDRLNRLLLEGTAPEHYATLFCGIYDDERRTLSYVNCGHNPPVLMLADGNVQRLEGTAPVIGLLPRWQCVSATVELKPGDLLVVFSDGVTEAESYGEEFGDKRIIDLLRSSRELCASRIVESLIDAVKHFSPDVQSDDLTVLVARPLPDSDSN